MPLYDPTRLEYPVSNTHSQIVLDNGQQLPAYLSYPARGNKFPGVVLIHDWWGVNDKVRQLAHGFAQSGFFVIVPDLFSGQIARTPQEAMALVQALGNDGFYRINTALSVLETHHQCNADVAAVGIGMGGSLAYEAAVMRHDLEAAVAWGGFPQRYLGRFAGASAAVLAIYGSADPYIKGPVIERLRSELTGLSPNHRVEVLPGMTHELFGDDAQGRESGKKVWMTTLDFLESHLKGPVAVSSVFKRPSGKKG